MEYCGNDDTRKKRDNTDVVNGDVKQFAEKTKKLRAAKPRPTLSGVDPAADETSQLSNESSCHVLDLEIALRQLVRIGMNQESKEWLSKTKWVQFRIGHVGDAAMLSRIYLQSQRAEGEKNPASDVTLDAASQDDTSLENRLVEGLGDEDSLPTILALLVDIFDDTGEHQTVGAAALISSGWEDSIKVMRVKMFYVSDDVTLNDIADLLERRMWLRLSALAIMTSNQMIVESCNQSSLRTLDKK
jgi:hypothetical protein